MFFERFCLFSLLIMSVVSSWQTTILSRNELLSRKRRYLTFPPGSNFGLSFAVVSNFLLVQPQGWKMLGELDYPFALPSDTRIFKHNKLVKRRSILERNEILSTMESMLTRNGINGTACIHRMVCESKQLEFNKGKSMVQDILYTILKAEEADYGLDYENVCLRVNFEGCPLPLLDFIIGSMSAKT